MTTCTYLLEAKSPNYVLGRDKNTSVTREEQASLKSIQKHLILLPPIIGLLHPDSRGNPRVTVGRGLGRVQRRPRPARHRARAAPLLCERKGFQGFIIHCMSKGAYDAPGVGRRPSPVSGPATCHVHTSKDIEIPLTASDNSCCTVSFLARNSFLIQARNVSQLFGSMLALQQLEIQFQYVHENDSFPS